VTVKDLRRDDSRYSRQEWIPTIGAEGQVLLSQSSVVVIGAGGVKSPLLLYLAAAGVGRITIIDDDRVELSNLNRQILYRTSDIGCFKAEAAAATLHDLNPSISVEPIVAHAGPDTFTTLLSGYDLVFEGGNSAEERRLFNSWAVHAGQRYIHASAQYNYAYVQTVVPGVSACFECSFDDLPQSHGGPVPIVGPAAGVAGSVAASEAIGMLVGLPPSLDSEIFFYDGWANWATRFPNPRRLTCSACQKREIHSLSSLRLNEQNS
jgi:molybdopterin/thiamine biosynthesis adenylyltransferase